MYKSFYNTTLLKKYIFYAFFLHLISAYFSQGFYKDDEHFSILEPIAYLLGLNEVIFNDNGRWYWDFDHAMRPWSQSYIYFCIISKCNKRP